MEAKQLEIECEKIDLTMDELIEKFGNHEKEMSTSKVWPEDEPYTIEYRLYMAKFGHHHKLEAISCLEIMLDRVKKY